MEYLSHIISNDGIQMDPKKIESVCEARPPKNQKELQSFLGLALYYWRFICSFSHVASPLSKLTSKQVKWKWTAEEQTAFEALKEALVSAPVLQYPNIKQPFQLCCDTSLYTIGACLEQTSDSQNWHVMAYRSKALNKMQLNWSATE